MDPRCFVDHFNALASVTQSTHAIVQQLRHKLNDTSEELSCERRMRFFHHDSLHAMASSLGRLETHLMGEAPRTPPHPKGVIKFSIASKGLTNQMSLTDVTVAFFSENYIAGFKLDKESENWKDLDAQERKRLRNHFATIERAVRMVLLHSDSCPSTPEDPSKFKEAVRRIAAAAEERIRNNPCFGDKTITIHRLKHHPDLRKFETSLGLPENTPENARKFFSSD